MPDIGQIIGCAVLAAMGIVFHLFQEDNPMGMFSSISKFFQFINEWLSSVTGIAPQWIASAEFGTLFFFGLGMMQIGEYAVAIACWVLLAFIAASRVLCWKGAVLRCFGFIAILFLCVLAITVTNLKRGEEPWSNLQKLRHRELVVPAVGGAPFSVRIERAIDQKPITFFWIMNPGMGLCPAEVGLFLSITNLQQRAAMISELTVEVRDGNKWVPLPHVHFEPNNQLYVERFSVFPPNMAGHVKTDVLEHLIVNKTIQPYAPSRGWMFFDNPLQHEVTVLRVTVIDTLGSAYTSDPLIPTLGGIQGVTFTVVGDMIDLRNAKKFSNCGDL